MTMSSSPTAPSPPRSARVPRPSLSATVLRLAAVALVAAVLVWSVLFVDLLRTRGERAAALTHSTGQLSSQSDPTPAPVTTRSS